MNQEQVKLWKDVYDYFILIETDYCSSNFDFNKWVDMLYPLWESNNNSEAARILLIEAYSVPSELYRRFTAKGNTEKKELNPDHKASTLLFRDAYRFFDEMYTDYTVNRIASPLNWAERLKILYEKHGKTVAAECILRGCFTCFLKQVRRDTDESESLVKEYFSQEKKLKKNNQGEKNGEH